mgnify:FL=1
MVLFSASCSFFVNANNQVVSFKGYAFDTSGGSGAVINSSLVTRKITASGELGAATVQGSALMSVNDYLEIHVTNETATNNVAVADFNFRAFALPTV